MYNKKDHISQNNFFLNINIGEEIDYDSWLLLMHNKVLARSRACCAYS